MKNSPKRKRNLLLLIPLVGCLLPILGVCAFLVRLNAEIGYPGGSPENIAIAPNGIALVGDIGQYSDISGTCAIWFVDTKTDQQVGMKRMSVWDPIYSSSTSMIYMPSGYSALRVVDSNTRSVVRSIKIPFAKDYSDSFSPMDALTELSNGNLLLSTSEGMFIIDATFGEAKRTSSLNSIYSLLAISDSKVYAAGESVWVLDGNTFETKREVSALPAKGFGRLTRISDTHAVANFATREGEALVLIDLTRDTAVSSIELGADPICGIVRISDAKLYVLHGQEQLGQKEPNGSYYISVVDIDKQQALKRILLPPEISTCSLFGETKLARAPNGKVYVIHGSWSIRAGCCNKDIGLYVIDAQTDQVVGNIPFVVPLGDYLFPFLD